MIRRVTGRDESAKHRNDMGVVLDQRGHWWARYYTEDGKPAVCYHLTLWSAVCTAYVYPAIRPLTWIQAKATDRWGRWGVDLGDDDVVWWFLTRRAAAKLAAAWDKPVVQR